MSITLYSSIKLNPSIVEIQSKSFRLWAVDPHSFFADPDPVLTFCCVTFEAKNSVSASIFRYCLLVYTGYRIWNFRNFHKNNKKNCSKVNNIPSDPSWIWIQILISGGKINADPNPQPWSQQSTQFVFCWPGLPYSLVHFFYCTVNVCTVHVGRLSFNPPRAEGVNI